jgi:hypothetical protein
MMRGVGILGVGWQSRERRPSRNRFSITAAAKNAIWAGFERVERGAALGGTREKAVETLFQ